MAVITWCGWAFSSALFSGCLLWSYWPSHAIWILGQLYIYVADFCNHLWFIFPSLHSPLRFGFHLTRKQGHLSASKPRYITWSLRDRIGCQGEDSYPHSRKQWQQKQTQQGDLQRPLLRWSSFNKTKRQRKNASNVVPALYSVLIQRSIFAFSQEKQVLIEYTANMFWLCLANTHSSFLVISHTCSPYLRFTLNWALTSPP